MTSADRAVALELEIATLQGEIESFRADWLRAVGVLVAEYHEVEARIADLGADPVARAAAHERSRRSRADLGAIPPPAGPPPTEDLKTLFRRAAKAMHPDLAPDEATRTHAEAFMKRLTTAYRAGDAAAIADLLSQWERGGRTVQVMPERTAQLAVDAAERRLEALRQSEFGRMLEASIQAALRGEDYLATLRERWAAALADARERLATLTP